MVRTARLARANRHRLGSAVVVLLFFAIGCTTTGATGSEPLPEWMTVEETSAGTVVRLETCPGVFTRIAVPEDSDLDPMGRDREMFIELYEEMRPAREACEAMNRAQAAADEAAALEAQRCQSVFVEDSDMEILHPRLTCQGDDLWDHERVTQCAERTVAGSAGPEFACYKIVVGADATFVGSRAPEP